jgi:hypothetical protein
MTSKVILGDLEGILSRLVCSALGVFPANNLACTFLRWIRGHTTTPWNGSVEITSKIALVVFGIQYHLFREKK